MEISDTDHGLSSFYTDNRTNRAMELTLEKPRLGKGTDSYFTKKEILSQIALWVAPFVKENDLFVDFSCGSNEFAPLLNCQCICYDIVLVPGGIQQDWLTVHELPKDAIIGLNPPFGYQGQLARKFVQHALTFAPAYLFLILPNKRWNIQGYETMFERELPNNAFYNPLSGKTYYEISTTFYVYKKTKGTGIPMIKSSSRTK